MPEIWVVVEHRNQTLADVSLQMLSKGRQLADQADAKLLAVVIGKDVSKYADELTKWADKVLAIRTDRLEESLAEPYQRILSSIIRERKPKLVLIGHSSFGMDLAPSLAIELEAPLATDCVDIATQNDSFVAVRSIYNGKINAVHLFTPSKIKIVTGRIGEFPIEEIDIKGQIEEIDFLIRDDFDYKDFKGYIQQEAGGLDITQADTLVSVGRGIKEKGNIEMAEELAQVLGGVVSCSRPVVDSGWLASERQVGLSGKTVEPKLYLTLGISGAFQHTVGMKGSKMIVAINKDSRAPIFNIADYGIVDDIFKVVPALTKKISELKGNRK